MKKPQKRKRGDETRPRANPTEERLRLTPFKDAREINLAEESLKKEIWLQLKRGQLTSELLKKEEFKDQKKILEGGLACRYSKEETNLVKVVCVEEEESSPVVCFVNENFAQKNPKDQALLEIFIHSMSKAYLEIFYRARGLAPAESTPAKKLDSESIDLETDSPPSQTSGYTLHE